MVRVTTKAVRGGAFTFASLAVFAALATAGPAAAEKKKSEAKKLPYAVAKRDPGQAMLAVISLDDQRVTIYDSKGAIFKAPVSSGSTGHETPVGIYSILQKNEEHYSNLYNSAAMPHMQRITWSGVALHGGPLPGYPASHGCVRLPYKFAKQLFGYTKLGTRVIISRSDVSPVPVSHPLLFKRTPYEGNAGILTKAVAMVGEAMTLGGPNNGQLSEPVDVTQHAVLLNEIVGTKTAEAEAIEAKAEPLRPDVKKLKPAMKRAAKALKSAQKSYDWRAKRVANYAKKAEAAKSEKSKSYWEKRRDKEQARLDKAQEKLDKVKADAEPKIAAYNEVADKLKALEDERDALRAEAGEAKQKMAPVSVFVSLKTKKLYVRQGFQPVFETPIEIRNPYKPIGTYTFTAVDYAPNGRDMRWNVVAVKGSEGRDRYYDDYRYSEYDDYWDRPRRRYRQKRKTKKATPTDVAAATAALERIAIPEEARARISKLVLRARLSSSPMRKPTIRRPANRPTLSCCSVVSPRAPSQRGRSAIPTTTITSATATTATIAVVTVAIVVVADGIAVCSAAGNKKGWRLLPPAFSYPHQDEPGDDLSGHRDHLSRHRFGVVDCHGPAPCSLGGV